MIPNLPRAPGPVAELLEPIEPVEPASRVHLLRRQSHGFLFGFLRCLPEVRAGLT